MKPIMSALANIEFQAPNGNWLKRMDCRNSGPSIKSAMEAVLKDPNIKKVRAVDPKTKQLIDMAFRQ
jgi:hypothetical protein